MIRPYVPTDYQGVFEIFRLNIPDFFNQQEEADLNEYLLENWQTYFVVEVDGKIVGAGGHHFPLPGVGRLSWDFFHPRARNQGWGRKLVNHSLEEIRKKNHVKKIEVWTSQYAWQFYARFGFVTHRVEKDFWAKGIDLYQMDMIADKTVI